MLRLIRRPGLWLGIALLILAAWGAFLIAFHGATASVLPVDAYFYLSKAENFMAGRGLTTYWNDGIDRKFFPMQSVVLAPFSLLKPSLGAYWIVPELLYYLLTALVLALLVRRVEPSRSVGFFALALWLANPNVLLWHSVPYSEGLATFFLWSAVLVCAGGWRSCSTRRFVIASGLAGLALVSRAEAGLIVPVVAVSAALTARREGLASIPWRRLALGLAIFCIPMAVWWISLPSAGGATRLAYVDEFWNRFTWEQLAYNFRVLFSSVLFEINLHPTATWMVITTIIGSRLYMIVIGLALSGVLGSRGRWVLLTIIAYQALHSFWHYSYGRFNLVILPLALYLLALGLQWIFASWWRVGVLALVVMNGDLLGIAGGGAVNLRPLLMINGGLVLGLIAKVAAQERESALTVNAGDSPGTAPAWKRLLRPDPLAYPLVMALALVMFNLGVGAIVRQKTFLAKDDLRSQVRAGQVEAIVSRIGPSDACLTSVDFPLAYQVGTLTGDRIWFNAGSPDFFPPAFDRSNTAHFLDQKNIGLILSERPRSEWIKEFNIPGAASGKLTLEKQLPGAQLLEWDS